MLRTCRATSQFVYITEKNEKKRQNSHKETNGEVNRPKISPIVYSCPKIPRYLGLRLGVHEAQRLPPASSRAEAPPSRKLSSSFHYISASRKYRLSFSQLLELKVIPLLSIGCSFTSRPSQASWKAEAIGLGGPIGLPCSSVYTWPCHYRDTPPQLRSIHGNLVFAH